MLSEELSTLFEATREDFEVENGQPTDVYLIKVRAVITSILLLTPYNEKHGNHNLIGLVWLTSKYKATTKETWLSISPQDRQYTTQRSQMTTNLP